MLEKIEVMMGGDVVCKKTKKSNSEYNMLIDIEEIGFFW